MQVFFEDLALPNLVRTALAEVPEWKSQRAGFSSDGTPNNLHVVRSMRGALGRRIALGNGLFLPSLPAQIDSLYAPGDSRRFSAYNVYYLGINLGGAPSELVLPPEAVDWLAEMLDAAPEVVEALPEAFHAPKGLPQALVAGLDAKLARAGGLAAAALLVGVTYQGGRRGHMLAFLDVASGAEPALARAAAEARDGNRRIGRHAAGIQYIG